MGDAGVNTWAARESATHRRVGNRSESDPAHLVGLSLIAQLQATAGNKAVVHLLATHPAGQAPERSPAVDPSVQRRPSAADRTRRRRAAKLKAVDARVLLQSSLPFALARLNAGQLAQMQRVLDESVVNPLVRVSESDKRLRLDFKTLLSSDALTTRSDNPDEGRYLKRVRQTLISKGVWLRFEPKLVRDPEDPSRHIFDPRAFEVWLSLGPDGDAIPSPTGELTREALLGTTLLGAGYYEQVHQGPAQSALDGEIKRLLGAIESGVDQHNMLATIRSQAFVGVAEASDLLGGADFPDRSIWDQPHQMVVRAMEMNVTGNLSGSQVFLVTAALLTRNAAQLLAQYIDDTGTGVQRAVKVLKVARTAGQVAEVGLAVTGIVGLARGGLALAGEGGGAALASDVDIAAEQLARRYAARNGIHADELSKVRYVPGPKGSVAGGVKPGTSSGAGTGFHNW